ncbi:zf-HC2 domain-containing protein [Cohnella ginsengisoli]|uniref:Anti-sigma-W factor RsiW n=1 Tax=Cohnella ginsengisoli TaxID=425004 RepID=A0A9X4KKZ9_9BACL|nr:zf-HC2 domain-containing protein [Cohnella ginsengisoli]MDG0793811.1 zf-HC2 domain-containing protein [Cohnella ginsengisoli]
MNEHPTESLSAYVDQELEAEERRRIEAHLLHCASCASLVDELIDMRSEIAGFYSQLTAPPDLEFKVLSALDGRLAKSAGTSTGLTAVSLVALAALIVLIVMYGATFFKLFSIALQFSLTAAYVLSNVASSIPAVWGAVLPLCAAIFVLSGLSLRRILRSTAP